MKTNLPSFAIYKNSSTSAISELYRYIYRYHLQFAFNRVFQSDRIFHIAKLLAFLMIAVVQL